MFSIHIHIYRYSVRNSTCLGQVIIYSDKKNIDDHLSAGQLKTSQITRITPVHMRLLNPNTVQQEIQNLFLCGFRIGECCLTTHRHNLMRLFRRRFHIHSMHYVNPTKNGKHVDIRAWFHMWLYMWQDGLLHVVTGPNWTFEARILWFECRQTFPRKVGQKVRGVFETHGYYNVEPHGNVFE